ncbi:MAG: metallophosphoesterase [Candidatus Helarchaeota archaeon]
MNPIIPITNEPALLLNKSPNQKYLVIADLHLGIEHKLLEKGVRIPVLTQTQRLIKKLKEIVKTVKPTSIIILGDVKHSIPIISPIEWQIVPIFFGNFRDYSIHIIIGNHDSKAQLEGLTTRNIFIHSARGCIITLTQNDSPLKVGLFHGHIWPDKQLFNVDVLIMAHNHPVIEFRNKFNVKTYEPTWIRAHWDRSKLAQAYLKHLKGKKTQTPLKILEDTYHITIASHTEILIMPAFNDLLGGIPFNNVEKTKFIGPLLNSQSVALDDAEVILLDGTILGKIREIR